MTSKPTITLTRRDARHAARLLRKCTPPGQDDRDTLTRIVDTIETQLHESEPK